MFKKISNKELIEFYRVLSLLLFSKVSIITALDLISKQSKNEKLKQTIKGIGTEIKSGSSFTKSFSKYPDLFTDIFIANLRVAEETGQIAEVLHEYTNYLEKMQTIKRKIMQALRYPIIVMTVAIGVVFFMLFFIIPTFESLFKSVKASLPYLTELLLSISNFFINHSTTILVLVIIIVFLIYLLLKSEKQKLIIFDSIIWRIPLLSRIYLNSILARFTLSMGILLSSKVNLVESLKISRNITKNITFRAQIDSILKKIIKGESFSSNIKSSKLFDLTFSKLLAAGEESAEMDKVFYMMSNFYSNEFDYYLDNITSLLEPILILFVGGIVAVILVALYLPMFEIINHFGV